MVIHFIILSRLFVRVYVVQMCQFFLDFRVIMDYDAGTCL